MALACALFFGLVASAQASSFRDSGLVNALDVTQFLEAERAGIAPNSHVSRIMASLNVTYAALPKNAYGNLGHQAVRYVLHRYFVQESGWFIKGLEPNNDTWVEATSPGSSKEWVPSYLQSVVEHGLGERGTNLRELAAMAAALEDLVSKEARARLELILRKFGLDREDVLEADDVRDVLTTYFVRFLAAGVHEVGGRSETLAVDDVFKARYPDWGSAEEWLEDTVKKPFSFNAWSARDVGELAALADRVGETYHRFNDKECRDLKYTLMDLEGNMAGRVRLARFYKMAFVSHWHFTEKPDYLRALGALDESNPNNPQVILSNYIMSRPNCQEASNLYAICCRNECEDLLGFLEAQFGTPLADPQRIIELVSELPSDTILAPRNLSSALVQRLDEVAAAHGGKVPLHGRLFAQWMHHAYPRECPYPGASSPQTPDEWISQTGQGATRASREEMERIVEADVCVSSNGSLPQAADCGASELPWSAEEQLLASEPVAAAWPASSAWDLAIASCLLFVVAADFAHRRAPEVEGTTDLEAPDCVRGERSRTMGWRGVAIVAAVALVAHACNLLDTVTFACTLIGGSCLALIQLVTNRCIPAPSKGDLFDKCV